MKERAFHLVLIAFFFIGSAAFIGGDIIGSTALVVGGCCIGLVSLITGWTVMFFELFIFK